MCEVLLKVAAKSGANEHSLLPFTSGVINIGDPKYDMIML